MDGQFTADLDPTIQGEKLFLDGKKQVPHHGQYSMPFKVLITALAPLPTS